MSLNPEKLVILNTLRSKELHIAASALEEYDGAAAPPVHLAHTHHHHQKSFTFNSDPLLSRSWFQIIIDSSHLITFFISIVVIIYASFKSLRIDKNLSETKSAAECTNSECARKQGCPHFNSGGEKNDSVFKEKSNNKNEDSDDDSEDEDTDDGDTDHGILGRNGKYGSVQTIDSKLALLIPVAASMSLLLMFYFFESIQTAFVICTSSKRKLQFLKTLTKKSPSSFE
jgi:hypothetical protein